MKAQTYSAVRLDGYVTSILHLVLAILVYLAAAGALAAEAIPKLVKPGEATSGSLLLASTAPGFYVEAPRVATDVKISISGPIARTRVTQRFENVSEAWVEGVYVFPLPDEAAVDTLKMQIGARFIEGEIEERQKAKAIYEKAKAEGKKASLLEQERANIFTNSVANIGPGETVIIQIEYQENVKLEDDRFSLRFPMVVAPRYNPPPKSTHLVNMDQSGGWGTLDPVPDKDKITPPVLHPDAGPANPVTLSVDLQAGFEVGDVTASYHKVTSQRRAEDHVLLTLTDEAVPANRDFELIWTPKTGKAPSAALFKDVVEGETYYLLMVTPPKLENETPPLPREVTFVIDTSGSMGGDSIRQAREALALAIGRLKAGDSFNVIQFNSQTDVLFNRPVPVTERNISTALGYVRALDAGGGTEMLTALDAALINHGTSGGQLRQIVFLTDGAIGNEQQLFETIASQRGDARIFTVGIGSAPNSFFMSRAAEIGQGAFTHIGDVREVKSRMTALLSKLETPAVVDLQTFWPNGTAVEAWPSPIPDLYRGETLVVAARASSDRGTVSISGTHSGAQWAAELPLERAATRPGISKLWARKKIAALELARASYGADWEALDKGILQTALTHTLVSRLTSLVAVDKTPTRPDDVPLESKEVPLNLPDGWDFEAVYGEQPQRASGLVKQASLNLGAASLMQAKAAPSPADVALPGTALGSDMKLLVGLLLMLMSGTLLWSLRPAARRR